MQMMHVEYNGHAGKCKPEMNDVRRTRAHATDGFELEVEGGRARSCSSVRSRYRGNARQHRSLKTIHTPGIRSFVSVRSVPVQRQTAV